MKSSPSPNLQTVQKFLLPKRFIMSNLTQPTLPWCKIMKLECRLWNKAPARETAAHHAHFVSWLSMIAEHRFVKIFRTRKQEHLLRGFLESGSCSESHQYLTNVQCCYRHNHGQTIHPKQKFISMNMLQTSCVET